MKKNKIIALVVGIISIAVLSLATYAWFTTRADTVAVNATAAKLGIEANELVDSNGKGYPYLPGETIIFNNQEEDDYFIKNTGNREVVVRVQFKITGETGILESGSRELIGDNRLVDIVKFTGGEELGGLVRLDSDSAVYYVYLKPGETVDAGDVTIELLPELGGNVKDSTKVRGLTDDVPDEQGAVFTLTYEIDAVQGTEAAVRDVFGLPDFVMSDLVPNPTE